MNNSKTVNDALIFATTSHKGQFRKVSGGGTAVPYIVHPVAVAMMLLRAGASDEIIAAALLHDVVEDTNITLATIRARFGDDVAGLVETVTEADKSLSWELRKSAWLTQLQHGRPEALAIALADKLHNMSALNTDLDAALERQEDPQETVWSHFKHGPKQQIDHARRLLALAEGRIDEHPLLSILVARLATEVGRLTEAVKKNKGENNMTMTIINLTQHVASKPQIEEGVFEPLDKEAVRNLLTFRSLPSAELIKERAAALAAIAEASGARTAMCGGALFLMRPLEEALESKGIRVIYAFSLRESVETPLEGGGTSKRSIFSHKGFVFRN